MPSYIENINIVNGLAYTVDNVVVYNIFLYNINKSTTKDQVLNFFKQFGEVLKVRIMVKNNRSTKIGFINFADSQVAAKVLKNRYYYLNGSISVKACYSWQQPGAETAESLRPNKLQIANDAQLHPKTDTETEQPSCSSTNSMELSALILNLNDDCLEQICKNLITSDQINFARTCQRFSDIFVTVSKVEYKMLILNKLESLTLWQIRQFLKIAGPRIESLVGKVPFMENKRIVEFLGVYCINSKRVNVAIDGYVCLQKLIGKMSLCTELALRNVTLTDDSIQIIKCMPKLKILKLKQIRRLSGKNICELTDIEELSLIRCDSIHRKHFKEIFKNLTNLRALDTRGCAELDSDDIQEIVKHFNKLESLKFSHSYEEYECIAQLPKLKSLEIVFEDAFEPIGYKIFEELVKYQSEQLEELILVYHRSLNLQKASLIGDFKKLKKLSCVNVNIDGQCLEKFCQLTELEEINLKDCYALTNNDLLNLLEHCPKLNRLNINSCRLITNAFIFDALKLLEKQEIQMQRKGPVQVSAFNTNIYEFVVDTPEFKSLSELMKVTFKFFDSKYYDDYACYYDDDDYRGDFFSFDESF